MERLTERVGNFIEVKGNKSLYSCEERKRAYLQNAIIRLCKYEDTGLTPEEIPNIVHCRDCKHRYPKDFSAYCHHRVGPLKPDGFCDRGERRGV